MCRFYSFLIDLAWLREPVEVIGEVHHQRIAAGAGIGDGMLGTRFLQPELLLPLREVVFGDKLAINRVTMSQAVNQSRTPPILGPTYAPELFWVDNHAAPLDKVTRGTNVFLAERFGTVERFLEFVEGQWEVAWLDALFCLSARGLELMGVDPVTSDVVQMVARRQLGPVLVAPLVRGLNAKYGASPICDFETFASAFRDHRNRVEEWREDRRTFLVEGEEEAPLLKVTAHELTAMWVAS